MWPKDVKLKRKEIKREREKKYEESWERGVKKTGGCAKDRLTTEAREIRP